MRVLTKEGVNTGKYAYTPARAAAIVERLTNRAVRNEKDGRSVSCVRCDRRVRFNHYHVYVIELDRRILTEKKRVVRRQNPGLDASQDCDCYYVGSTRHRCECRFEQHIRFASGCTSYLCIGCYDGEKKTRYFRKEGTKGTKGSKIAGKYGICLRPEQYSNLNPIADKKTSLKVEEELAQFLRTNGAMVIQS